MTEERERFMFGVSGASGGERVDVFLARQGVFPTRSQIKRAIERGGVRVNGTVVKAAYRVREHDAVEVEKEPPLPARAEPEDIALDVIFEDEHLIVVNKPAGMVVHPAAGNYRGTLVNALLHHCRDLSGVGGVQRPGIVHRLDKNTSGLIVAAKNDDAHLGLAEQFKKHEITKIYAVFVHGDVRRDSGVVDLAVGRHPGDRKKMSAGRAGGKEAMSRWTVVERFGPVTLLDVRIETGRTHQIRVHMHAMGHSVVGDDRYGNSRKQTESLRDGRVRAVLGGIGRQALHARLLGLTHPVDGRYLEFQAPLPDDMARLLRELNAYRTSVV